MSWTVSQRRWEQSAAGKGTKHKHAHLCYTVQVRTVCVRGTHTRFYSSLLWVDRKRRREGLHKAEENLTNFQ